MRPAEPIYLDHAATTPVRDEVRAAMEPYLSDVFGNPSSMHRWGRRAAAALDVARARAASALGAQPSQVRFVRGGTESDNLALMGRCRSLSVGGSRPTLVVSAIEHPAVLDCARHLAAAGEVRLVVLAVGQDGSLDLAALDEALQASALLVSLMWVNNETGLLLDVAEAAARVRAAGGTFHTDAVQAVGKVPVDVGAVAVDLLSVTAHKIYGPRGTGLLYTRTDGSLSPQLHGGGQERGLRPGTEDVAGAVGLATALELAVAERANEAVRLGRLRDELERRVLAAVAEVRVNAGGAPRAPHVSSLGVADVDGHALLMALDLEGVAASGGSACSSGSAKGSHVIAALYGESDARATIRFSLGRHTTEEHVVRAADATAAVIARLRRLGDAA